MLLQVGRVRLAYDVLDEARRIDPASPAANVVFAHAALILGKFDEADRYVMVAEALGRRDLSWLKGSIALARGDRTSARREFDLFASFLGVPRFADYLVDPEPLSKEQLREFEHFCSTQVIPWGCHSFLATRQGYEAAIATVRKEFFERELDLSVLWTAGMSGLRRQAGFKALVRDIGLVDYWRQYAWADSCMPKREDFSCT
jgi:hypothetical protein